MSDNENLTEILKVAKKVRHWADKLARRKGLDPSLCGLCAKASSRLWLELKNVGIQAKLLANYGHVFLEVGDFVVDITATQFRSYFSPVMIVPKCIAHGYSFWTCEEEYKDSEELDKRGKLGT